MELLLRKHNLWKHVIEGKRPSPIYLAGAITNQSIINEWDNKDDEARGTIGLLVMDDQLCHIRNMKTAADTWNALKEYHEKNTLSNKVYLMRSICSLKLEESGDAVAHISAMNDLFTKLSDIGEDALSDKWSAAMLLSSLPESYDTLTTSLESRKEDEITFALVQQKVIAEYERRLHAGNNVHDAVLKVVAKNGAVCYFCKKPGHQKKNCGKYKNWKLKQSSNNNNFNKINSVEEKSECTDFLFTFGKNKKCCWLVDSGATRHAVNEYTFFTTINNSYKSSIELANGETDEIEGIGSGEFVLCDENGNQNKILAKEVLYAPNLVGNILSVRQLTKVGFDISFKKNICYINFENKNIGVADLKGEMYILRQFENINAIMQHNKNCIHQWNRKLGHRNPEAIRKMFSENLAEDFKIVECNIKEICETCAKGKLTRTPFPKQSLSKSTEPLQLIHTDVCGPMQTTTPSGKRYIVTFIDDYSGFTTLRLLSRKSEVEEGLKDFVIFCRTRFGRAPKVIRSDRGGEYTAKNFIQFLKSEGIENQLTAPYSPQQNGKAERKNRTLIEMARCMLIDANLPYTFWGEAVSTANYIQNRVFSKTKNSTPHELWYGSKPSFKQFHIFGSKCFVHIPSEKRRKLDDTALKMIFLGYDNNSKAFRCYNNITKRVVISRDVRFTDCMYNSAEKQVTLDFRKQTDLTFDPLLIEEENSTSIKMNDITINNEAVAADENINTSEQNSEAHLETQTPTVRVSSRENKGKEPRRLINEIWLTREFKEPKSYQEAINSDEKQQWLAAMQDEMESMKNNQTWELVNLPEKASPIGSKWVYKIKRNAAGDICRFKARLVAQGFSQKYGIDYDEVFAPVVSHITFRILLSIAGTNNMIVNHIDAKTAFLNGNLSETIFMKQPQGFQQGNENIVCLLKKSIYGLKQSARSWNNTLHKNLLRAEFKQSLNDPCLYYGNIYEKVCYIIVYVDDLILACSTKYQIAYIENKLSSSFAIQNLGELKHYLGIEISKDKDGNFQLCQSTYINKTAKEFGLEESKPTKTPMDLSYGKGGETKLLENNNMYRKLVGHILYISVNSRPDISAAISILAQKVSHPTNEDWNQCKRILKYLKTTANLKLLLSNRNGNKELIGYADASWADDRIERKSNSGRIFFYNGGTIAWSCQKQTLVATSTCEAEYISLSEAAKEAKWIRQILADLHQPMYK